MQFYRYKNVCISNLLCGSKQEDAYQTSQMCLLVCIFSSDILKEGFLLMWISCVKKKQKKYEFRLLKIKLNPLLSLFHFTYSSSKPLGSPCEPIVYPSSRCPSVIHNFQRSTLKLLGQSEPNFMWTGLGKEEPKFI